jgi:hypothetical protein
LSSNREKSDEHEHRGGRNYVPSDPDLHHAMGRDRRVALRAVAAARPRAPPTRVSLRPAPAVRHVCLTMPPGIRRAAGAWAARCAASHAAGG